MRFVPRLSSLFACAALSAAACAANPTPQAAAPEAAPAAPETSVASDPASKPRPDDDSWSGEKTAKSGDSTPSEAKASAETESPAANGKGPETRTMEVIAKLIKDNRKAARKCYDDARKDSKDLKGDVVIHFVLNPEGKLKSIELNRERSTLTTPAVVDCVIGVIKGLQFPKSSRAMETSINYPFNFTP